MRLKLTLHRPGDTYDDVVVSVDPGAAIGHLAAEIQRVDPRAVSFPGHELTLAALDGDSWVTLPMDVTVAESGICSGSSVTVTPGSTRYLDAAGTVAATLRVLEGPESGREFPLHHGTNVLGRDYDSDVRFTDALVSKRHAKINITDVVEVLDQNSANGVLIGGGQVTRYVLAADTEVTVGDTRFVVARTAPGRGRGGGAGSVPFNRSPRLDPQYEGVVEEAPAPPDPPRPQHFPIVSLLVPIAMGAVLYQVTKSAASLAFIALSPLMLVGTATETRMVGRRAYRRATTQFRFALSAMAERLDRAAVAERDQRQQEHPATQDVVRAVRDRTPLLWTRRPEHGAFLQLRLGLGTLPSRSSVDRPSQGRQSPDLYDEILAVEERFRLVDGVPVVADLREGGGVGVAGPLPLRHDAVRALMVQLVGLHSPQEVQVAVVAPPSSVREWHWLSWLPHSTPERSPLGVSHLATAPDVCARLVSALEGLVDTRKPERGATSFTATPTTPAIVVLVEEGAPVERGRLVELAETGTAAGVFVIWTASTPDLVPAACRTFLTLDPNSGRGRAGFVHRSDEVSPLEVELLPAEVAARIARDLSPVIDAGAATDDESELPSSVSFLDLSGRGLADDVEAIADQWRLSNSLPIPGQKPLRLKRDNTLKALIGESGGAPFHLDLREQGPHALIGGTTGAGKSELLQAWILGMASAHSPSRVNFLFVDYKGGAAFSKCVELPHTVGLVTDLSPRLVQRVLTSLKAELRYREHLLNRKKAKDLLSLERAGDPDAPPSLVIVVDEFAALAKEVPEFVDGMVDVAQRGRSLGLHLILATQRPAGVIRDNLRANTNLRIALRMADEADSTDVIGSALAAGFDPRVPGRAVAKTGPGRTVPFQGAYAGGWTSDLTPPPPITVEELTLAGSDRWEAPDDPAAAAAEASRPTGPNDLERIVRTVRETAEGYGFAEVRRPWLDELSPVYNLARLPSSHSDAELVFGVLDDPDGQRQPTVSFFPDQDGSMAVYGTGGAGKSAFLRTLAIAAADTVGDQVGNGPCHVYGLDFGARGLTMLEDLPHVGSIVSGDDHERIVRLVRTLRGVIDERAVRYARAAAGTIAEYRALSGRRDEPRILLLVDGMGAFRQAYEVGPHGRLFETFMSLALDGRNVGVHVVVTAERTGAIPTSLAASLQRRLVLRLTSETDLSTLGVPLDGFSLDSPPGRGFLAGMEVQVAVYGGTSNVAEQSALIRRLAERVGAASAGTSPRAGTAPAIGRLAERVSLSDLGALPGGVPVLGMAEDSLQATGFTIGDVLVVAGPPQSGKTTTLASLVTSIGRARPDTLLYYFGNRRSLLPSSLPWTRAAATPDDVAELAGDIARVLEKDPAAPGTLAVVIEGVAEFLNSKADVPLQELIKACRNCEQTVIAEGETSGLTGSWPLLQAVKSSRHGLVLQPDQGDGDLLFRTSFPRSNRSDFPPGRANYVRSGRVARVQVALPE